jgi:hypothetical protein
MRGLMLAAGLLSLFGTQPARATPSPFANWAVVVISGDDEAAHVDAHTEAFDNARRDIGRALERRGFAAANIAEYSVEPNQHPDTRPGPAEFDAIAAGLRREAQRTGAGCLIYLTSHGSPDGAVLGDRILPPRALSRMIGSACGARPTVVVVSACFSGVFVPILAGPDRLVLTAARRDRSSFGCGEADTYPFFDGCVLESLPTARDFLVLAARTKACVARRELEEKVAPPSEPQISIGARFHVQPFPAPG